jgi:hypothetical protein
MDSEGIKERFMTNIWLLFSEGLATEALYNILTRPTMGLFRKAFLDLLLTDVEEGFDDYSVRINADHGGTAVSLEIHTEKQVIFIEPKFFGSAEDCISSRTAILRKEYPFFEERILCILSMIDRQGEVEKANKSEVDADYAVEFRSLLWSHILGVFARVRREPQQSTEEKDTAIEPSQIGREVGVKRRRIPKAR